MQLNKLNIIGKKELQNIIIQNGRIIKITSAATIAHEPVIEFDDVFAFPGLINSHDHLDFNSFPQMGNRIYSDYKEWGDDIYKNNKEIIKNILSIPKELRIQWGLYKNLLNGITTVVNHGEPLMIKSNLITVFQNCQSLHSLQFEKNWKWRLKNPFKIKYPCVIHIGEGTNEKAVREIDLLIKANLFRRSLIGIHGVAMNEQQSKSFKALVWCPASNFFLLGRTAAIDLLNDHTRVLFGSDSTLTASWNFWEQLRQAKNYQQLDDAELIQSVTSTAAAVWGLNSGAIAENKVADIVLVKRKKGMTELENFYSLNPQDLLLVIQQGKIKLADESIIENFESRGVSMQHLSHINLNGTKKYVQGNLLQLARAIRQYYPGAEFPFSV